MVTTDTTVCDVAREMVFLDRLDQLERLLALPRSRTMKSAVCARTTWLKAIAASRAGAAPTPSRSIEAAASWLSFGDPYEQAHALLGQERTSTWPRSWDRR
jgi:hypothetical protein